MTKIQKVEDFQALGWTVDSVIQQNNNISKCKPLGGSSCIKLFKKKFE